MNAIGVTAPVCCAFGEAEPGADLGETVACCPAHDCRMGVDRAARAEFPQSGVGLVPSAGCLLAKPLQPLVEGEPAHGRQPLVKETLGDRQDDGTVAVVLNLRVGCIAPADRAIA